MLLLAPSVSALQLLLSAYEKELKWLDMSINVQKFACLRIGPRYNAKCKCITTSSDVLDILECTFAQPTSSHAQFATPRNRFVAPTVFGKIGRIAFLGSTP